MSAQQEQEHLRAQVQESATVVGQWQQAYNDLQQQYETMQVISCFRSHVALLPCAWQADPAIPQSVTCHFGFLITAHESPWGASSIPQQGHTSAGGVWRAAAAVRRPWQ
jgi:hypothetical protein